MLDNGLPGIVRRLVRRKSSSHHNSISHEAADEIYVDAPYWINLNL